MSKYDVFISYRREDSSDRANLIRSYLLEWFDNDRIFLDTHEIHEGDFPEYIDSALSTSKYFIVIISKASFKQDRLNTLDYYIEEIKRAINNQLIIIPIVYDDLDLNNIKLPSFINDLKTKNAIISHTDNPVNVQSKLQEFIKIRKRNIKDFVRFPLAIITIFSIISVVSGLSMYIYDNFFMSYDKSVEIAYEYIFENDGKYYYPIRDNELVCYDALLGSITKLNNNDNVAKSLKIRDSDLYKAGFWSTATTLVYYIVKSKYKPHSRKQFLAYLGAAVAVVSGIGFGITVEQMLSPFYRSRLIENQISNKNFWNDLLKFKYSPINKNYIRYEKI